MSNESGDAVREAFLNSLHPLQLRKVDEARAVPESCTDVIDRDHLCDLCDPSQEAMNFEAAGWRFIHCVDGVAPVSVPAVDVYRPTAADADGTEHVGGVCALSHRLGVLVDRDAIPDAASLQSALANVSVTVDEQQDFLPPEVAAGPDPFAGLSMLLFSCHAGADADCMTIAAEIAALDGVLHAEPEVFCDVPTRAFRPTDVLYPQQWQWNNTGRQIPGSKPGADVEAEKAWAVTKGAGVNIAVIDAGMAVDHPDLQPRIVGGATFSYLGTELQWRFGVEGFFDSPHGTACAGLAVAEVDDVVGGCGIACEANLIPIAATRPSVYGDLSVAASVLYATDPRWFGDPNGVAADVISCSLGNNSGVMHASVWLKFALFVAATYGRGGKGIPVFWSVSNSWTEIQLDEVVSSPYTIAVGNATASDRVQKCAYGPQLDFLAPGTDVLTTITVTHDPLGLQNGEYLRVTGTSMAAPVAAGIGALILSLSPDRTWTQVRDWMRDHCDKIGRPAITYDANGHNPQYGYGRVNAWKCVENLP